MRHPRLLVCLLTSVGLLMAASAPIGGAGAAVASQPSVTLQPAHRRVTVGQDMAFRYRVTHVAKQSTVALQRQVGLDKVWKTVAKSSAHHGTITSPKITQMGRYVFRLVDLNNGSQAGRSRVRPIYAYDNVPLMALCRSMKRETFTLCGTRHKQVNGKIFTYTMRTASHAYPDFLRAASMPNTSCRSLSLHYVTTHPSRGRAYLQIVQGSTDPQEGHVGTNTIGSFRATLDGGPLYFNVATNRAFSENAYSGTDVLFSGSASCYTVNGKK